MSTILNKFIYIVNFSKKGGGVKVPLNPNNVVYDWPFALNKNLFEHILEANYRKNRSWIIFLMKNLIIKFINTYQK